MVRRGWLILLPLCFAVLCWSSFEDSVEAARPTKRAEARVQFRIGQKQFKAGQFAEALESFNRSYELSRHPDILFMIAQCQRNLKQYARAIAGFKGYLRDKPEAPDRDEVNQLIQELRQKQEEADAQAEAEGAALAPAPPKAKPASLALQPIAPLVPSLSRESRRGTPVYKRWWFWALVGGAVAAAAGAGALIAHSASGEEVPSGSLGTLDLR